MFVRAGELGQGPGAARPRQRRQGVLGAGARPPI